VRGVGRYFLSEDTLIQGEVAYGETGDFEDGDKGEFWNWGVKGKMRLSDSMPIYGTAEYRGSDLENSDDDEEVTEHAFLVGLGFAFGATSLWENDRRGVTLDTPMLPARAAAYHEAFD
jgi:hypothetical protein